MNSQQATWQAGAVQQWFGSLPFRQVAEELPHIVVVDRPSQLQRGVAMIVLDVRISTGLPQQFNDLSLAA